MAGVLKIEISESADSLKTRLNQESNALKRAKLQVLWWIQTGQSSQVHELAKWGGHHRTTVSRWLSAYRRGGLDELLRVKPKPGRKPTIPPDVLESLKQELQDREGFGSYIEVCQWLAAVHGLKVPYKTVHRVVRYGLKAKLKRPRPVSEKQADGAVETHKKT